MFLQIGLWQGCPHFFEIVVIVLLCYLGYCFPQLGNENYVIQMFKYNLTCLKMA